MNQPDLRSFLIGKWQQEYGPYVTETVFTAAGTFTSITFQLGAPYRQNVQGRWEVKYGNQLWQEWDSWNPSTLPKPLPEGTTIEVIDSDHFRNKLGIVARIR
jgi:hypothetical protein